MNTSEIIDAQIALPSPLYQVLEQRSHTHKRSVSHEIVTLLTQLTGELKQECSEWEAASDEDWLAIEAYALGAEKEQGLASHQQSPLSGGAGGGSPMSGALADPPHPSGHPSQEGIYSRR